MASQSCALARTRSFVMSLSPIMLMNKYTLLQSRKARFKRTCKSSYLHALELEKQQKGATQIALSVTLSGLVTLNVGLSTVVPSALP